MKRHYTRQPLQALLAVTMPLAACLLQWMFWRAFQPYVWFFFYPAVFFSFGKGGAFTFTLPLRPAGGGREKQGD